MLDFKTDFASLHVEDKKMDEVFYEEGFIMIYCLDEWILYIFSVLVSFSLFRLSYKGLVL